MKTINIDIKILETIDGFRVDINDWDLNEHMKLNPETKREAVAIAMRFLNRLVETEVL